MTVERSMNQNGVELRKRAEAAALERARFSRKNVETMSLEKIREMLHEIDVQQIELEMQNEELIAAQAELDSSRARFIDLYDLAPAGYCTLSDKGLILEINLTAATMLGVPRSALVKQSISRFILKDDQDIYFRHSKRLFETGETQVYELRMLKQNGKEFWGQLITIATQSNDGALECFVSIIDSTERKEAELALRENEEKFRSYVENAPYGVFTTDASGRYHDVNPAAESITGYSRGELLGMSILDLLPEDARGSGMEHFTRLLESGSSIGEVPFLKKGGERRFWSVSAVRLSEDRFLGFVEDITDRKITEEELLRSAGNLKLALEGTIQAMAMAVEIRDPYTAGHQRRVADLAGSIAAEMGMDEEQVHFIRIAGRIHDIGKISVPAEILSKPGKLSEAEFNLIKAHPQTGYDIFSGIEIPWPVADVIYQHHERIDGSGYPRGLKGKDILLEARILAVADVVEAMASHRPYRPAVGLDEGLEEIFSKRGILYDPDVVDACLALFREKQYRLVDV
jgi:PAS domain S-box-containing protein